MKDLSQTDSGTRARLRAELTSRYEAFKARGLALDMTRGKPCPEQLDLALGMLDCVTSKDWRGEVDDYRNYGLLDGIPEAKRLFADYMGVSADRIIVGGNASLPLMHATVRNAMLHGVPGGAGPWARLPRVRFLCPSPGYDRHFTICQYFGIEMIPVAMQSQGPDMDEVERLVAADDSIKGMWCVPQYSNPTGATYSDAVVERLASMPTRAPDFRVLWDNAYAVHHLYDTHDVLANIAEACARAGHPDRPILFGSTAKVSFAGGGVGVIAGSKVNIDDARKHLFTETIGHDKLNQLRHVRFFRDMAGIEAHMRKHAAILRPKFEAVESVLARELGGSGIAQWTRPRGGYFVSVDLPPGSAQAVVKMAAQAGVKLTGAGATFPLGQDPADRNLRLAPSFPATEDVRQAMELFTICVQRVALEQVFAA